MSASVGSKSVESGVLENMGIAFCNFDSSCSRKRVITISCLATAILFYPSVMMSASVGDESIESGVPENMGIAFGILILAILEPDEWVIGLTPPPLAWRSCRKRLGIL